MSPYEQKMSKYNELTRLIANTCVSQNAKMLALKFTIEQFEQSMIELDDCYASIGKHWRHDSLIEGYIKALELKKVPAQKRVIKYLELVKSTTETNLYRLFNAKTIDTMIDKDMFNREAKSRLRQDDQEMVYWTEVTLKTKLEQVVK